MNDQQPVWILYIGATEPVAAFPEQAAAAIGNGLAVEYKQPEKPE